MTFIKTRVLTSKPESEFDKTIEQGLLTFIKDLVNVINGGIRVDENLNAYIATIADTGTANSENAVAHTLKRIPIGFITISRTGIGVIYNGASAWTATNIYIKSTSANNSIKLLIF